MSDETDGVESVHESPDSAAREEIVPDAEPIADADSAIAPTRRRGFYLTPRQAFLTMAGVLAVVLVGLVLYLWWLTRPADFTVEPGGQSQGGLVPKLTVYGPGREPEVGFNQPMGVAWGADGDLMFVADALNNRICVFDAQGRPVREFGSLGVAKPLAGAERSWDPGEFSYPVDVAVAEDGTIYVADFYNDSISAFAQDGRFIRRFPDPYAPTGKGSSGADGGGIAVTALATHDGRIYATDTYQVFIFDSDGNVIDQFGQPGQGPEGLDHPGGIAVDRDGRIYVSDSNHNRVKAYTPEGELLWVTGRPVSDLKSETKNPFTLPRGMTVLRDGSILVADPLAQQLVRLDRDGKVVAQYGVRGTLDGQLNFPNDVSALAEDILVADRQNQRIQVVNLSSR